VSHIGADADDDAQGSSPWAANSFDCLETFLQGLLHRRPIHKPSNKAFWTSRGRQAVARRCCVTQQKQGRLS
jgi:hypothetical protein